MRTLAEPVRPTNERDGAAPDANLPHPRPEPDSDDLALRPRNRHLKDPPLLLLTLDHHPA